MSGRRQNLSFLNGLFKDLNPIPINSGRMRLYFKDDRVNLNDLSVFADKWLFCE